MPYRRPGWWPRGFAGLSGAASMRRGRDFVPEPVVRQVKVGLVPPDAIGFRHSRKRGAAQPHVRRHRQGSPRAAVGPPASSPRPNSSPGHNKARPHPSLAQGCWHSRFSPGRGGPPPVRTLPAMLRQHLATGKVTSNMPHGKGWGDKSAAGALRAAPHAAGRGPGAAGSFRRRPKRNRPLQGRAIGGPTGWS